jgi:hypothetical protein
LVERFPSTVGARARGSTLPEAPATVKRKTAENARRSTIRRAPRFARFARARIAAARQSGTRARSQTPDLACKYGRFEEMPLDPIRRMAMVGATVG